MTAIIFENIHDQTHQFSAGLVTIEQEFTANLLAVDVTTKPEYEANSQIIGYLYQVYGEQGKGYALRTGKDLIRLDLPQTDRLIFAPTAYLSDSFTLKIEYTTIGISAVIDGENIAAIPEQILSLPNNLQAIDLQLDQIEQAIAELGEVDWTAILNKPTVFPPVNHNHVIADVSLLGLELQSLDTRLDLLESAPPPISVISGYLPLSTNQVLEVNKKYLATVSGLICTLPSSPNIGDFVEISTGNFDLRVNHGNASQIVRNNSTNTIAGIDGGIILKAYSAIKILFVGGDLWISNLRVGTINNWQSPALEEQAVSQKNYTATALRNLDYFETFDLSRINNGILANDSPYIYNASPTVPIKLSFANPVALKGFDYTGGQHNGPFTSNNPISVKIYLGESVNQSNLIGDYQLIKTLSTQNIIVNNDQFSESYCFEFIPSNSGLALGNELVIFGKSRFGGEVSVI